MEDNSKTLKKTNKKKSDVNSANEQQIQHEFEFFYGRDSPFSQFHSVEFSVNGVKYSCTEQFMMHGKAVLFKDHEIAEKILQATVPLEMKKLGRKVRNFDQATWEINCQMIVEEGNEAKFSQNEDLKKMLYATFPKTLTEASPGDRIWGIGLRKDNPLAWDKRTWRGKNLLGYALTRVRDKLMKQDGLLDESLSIKE